MKDIPVLMNGAMVRAILEDRKTQTRRIMDPQAAKSLKKWGITKTWQCAAFEVDGKHYKCPYGEPGDRLWVLETWMPDAPCDGTWGDVSFYGCKDSPLSMIPERFKKPEHCIYRATWKGSKLVGWKSSMPRWASRITLEVTAVRVEQLQDISEEDAIKEGVTAESVQSFNGIVRKPAEFAFRELWIKLYGVGLWEYNPWVWVVEFKQVDQPRT